MWHFIEFNIDIIFILLHFFVFLFTYRLLEKQIFQPAVLFSLVWFIIITLRLAFKFSILDQLEPISVEAYSIFLVGCIFFSVGSCVMHFSLARIQFFPVQPAETTFKICKAARILFLAVIVLGLPFYVLAAYKIFIASQIEGFFMSLRYELSYGEADIGPLKYLMPLSYVILALNLYSYYGNKSKINLVILICTFLITTIYAVLATGRTFFFMILVIYLGISYLSNLQFSLRKLIMSVGAFLMIFVFFGIVLGKGGNTDYNAKENVRSASEFLGIYLVSSLNAFDLELSQHTEGELQGDNSMRFFLKAAMGLNLMPKRKINEAKHEFVFVPYPTNTYTYYNYYLLDFGRVYAWIMLGFYGAFHTWLFYQAKCLKRLRYMLYYTFLLFPLLLSFFSDLYLSLFSFWFQMVFFTELLLWVNQFFIRNTPLKNQASG